MKKDRMGRAGSLQETWQNGMNCSSTEGYLRGQSQKKRHEMGGT